MQKAGGVPLEADEIMRFISIGIVKVRELDQLIEKRLLEDWSERKVEVR